VIRFEIRERQYIPVQRSTPAVHRVTFEQGSLESSPRKIVCVAETELGAMFGVNAPDRSAFFDP
jgi:hypothetical protein